MQESNKVLVILVGAILLFFIGLVLHQLQAVLIPLVLATLISHVFSPLVIRLKALKVPISLILLLVLVLLSSVIGLAGLLIYTSTRSFLSEIPKYEARLSSLLDGMVVWIRDVAAMINVQFQPGDLQSLLDLSSLGNLIGFGIETSVFVTTWVFLIILCTLFILAGTGELSDKLAVAFPDGKSQRLMGIVQNVGSQIREYIVKKTLISLGVGTLTGVTTWLMGVDFPLTWGLVAFLLNFIPNVGSAIAVLFPTLLAFLQFDTIVTPLMLMAILISAQALLGNVVEPRVFAVSLNLSPLLILISLILWGWLWGAVGMVLAVPIMATIKIICENVEILRPMAILMSRSSELETRADVVIEKS